MNSNVPTLDLSTPSADQFPRVIVAPELIGQEGVVISEADETDDEYRSRCDLFALLLDHAKTG